METKLVGPSFLTQGDVWDSGRSETTEKVGKVKKKTGQHGIIEASNTRGCGDAEDQGKAVELL